MVQKLTYLREVYVRTAQLYVAADYWPRAVLCQIERHPESVYITNCSVQMMRLA